MSDSQQNLNISERLALLEAKVAELESRLSNIPQPRARVELDLAESRSNILSVKLINKGFHKYNYEAGDSGDRIELHFQFSNNSSKDIRAFTGVVVFCDLFDRDILKVNLTDEGGIKAGGTTIWQGGIEYNQFMEEHNRLLTIDQEDLQVSFILQQVIYKDGTREKFNLKP
jgi:hypothetical protein